MSVTSDASASRPSTGGVDAVVPGGSLTRGTLKKHNQATEDRLDALLERSQVLSSLLQKVDRAMAEEEAAPPAHTTVASHGAEAKQPAAAARGPDAPRGASDSSKALQASSINGGGCLPPPTPREKIADTLATHMARAANPRPRSYVEELPTSLAWRTSTQTMMVTGLAGEVTPEELAKVPQNLFSSGIVLRKGARRRNQALEYPLWRPLRARAAAVPPTTPASLAGSLI